MRQIEMTYGFGDMPRLFRVKLAGLTFVHRAKAAVARACIAAEHKCCGLIGPTFKNIRAFCFLADGMQIQAVDQLKHRILVAWVAEFDLQPVRFFQTLAVLAANKFLYQDILVNHINAHVGELLV